MSWVSDFTGRADRKRAKAAQAKADQAFAQQEGIFNNQLMPWQNAYSGGYYPQMQYVQGLQNTMLGANPVSYQEANPDIPSWLIPSLTSKNPSEKRFAELALYNLQNNPSASYLHEDKWNTIVNRARDRDWNELYRIYTQESRPFHENQWQVPTAGWQAPDAMLTKEIPNQPLPWFLQTPQGTQGLMGTSSYQGETPWWANVPQNTDDIAPAFSTLQALGMQRAAGQLRNNMAQFNAQRGVPMSGEQAGYTPGFQNNWYQMLAAENANKALALNDIMTQRRAEGQNTAFNLDNLATQRRGEAQGNFFNLGQYGQGLMSGAMQIPQIGMNMYGNRMGTQNANAQNFWQSASQHNPFGDLLGIAGMWAGGGFKQPQMPQMWQAAQPYTPTNYINSGAGMNFSVGTNPFGQTGYNQQPDFVIRDGRYQISNSSVGKPFSWTGR